MCADEKSSYAWEIIEFHPPFGFLPVLTVNTTHNSCTSQACKMDEDEDDLYGQQDDHQKLKPELKQENDEAMDEDEDEYEEEEEDDSVGETLHTPKQ